RFPVELRIGVDHHWSDRGVLEHEGVDVCCRSVADDAVQGYLRRIGASKFGCGKGSVAPLAEARRKMSRIRHSAVLELAADFPKGPEAVEHGVGFSLGDHVVLVSA